MKKSKSYSVYFGGELFSAKHLIGNAYLAEAIYERSHGRYQCELPQEFDTRRRSLRGIRDQDIQALLAADAAIFNYDGTELDSGTVVEFMFAKFADIPAVLLRTDIRRGGDQLHEPWNLMTSYFPRTVTVLADSLSPYRAAALRHHHLDAATRLAGQHATAAAQVVCDRIAAQVVRALDRVVKTEPVMPRHLREEVYHWLALMPAMHGRPKALRRELEKALSRKIDRDLL
ncbi:MAG TPA: nucleoside 2-deoxyribosyltransferase [Opitutaceae bacterium]|nr:nucleoside 2-deoxyribosyltransferase [Opitutaceae bacterium]